MQGVNKNCIDTVFKSYELTIRYKKHVEIFIEDISLKLTISYMSTVYLCLDKDGSGRK